MSSIPAVPSRPRPFPDQGPLSAERSALLVIDMQVDFLSVDGYLAKMGYDPAPLRRIIPTVTRLIQAARRAGMLVLFTRQGYRADLADMSPQVMRRRQRAGLAGTTALLRGSPGFELIPEIRIEASDVVVDKTANGAFSHTDLDLILRAKGITHLVFTGCTTDVCVHSTLREATDRGYECLLVEDGCASGDAYAHAAAVHMVTVEDGIFGGVSDAGTLLDCLSRALPAVPCA